MLIQNQSLFIQRPINKNILLRKNIKVKSSKLPYDFFDNSTLNRYIPKKRSLKKSIAEENTRETYTPSFQRLEDLNSGISISLERKIGTARVNMNKEEDLINDVINTTRNLKRVFRRKSLQMVKQSYQRQEVQLNLPKINNVKKGNHFF